MDLPADGGTYVLIVQVAQTRCLEIGRLGRFEFRPGYYAYVGSAAGPGGIRARVQHHLESVAAPHWHIDYLLTLAIPLELWYAISDRRLERDWAELLQKAPGFREPIPRFGSSDYRRSRASHLFYSKRRPAFRWFEATVRRLFEPDIRPWQWLISHTTDVAPDAPQLAKRGPASPGEWNNAPDPD